jgi:putative ABC transport system substrate-binding protein
MASYIARRKFLATLGGAAAAWPLAARGQQGERMRRIGILMPYPPINAEMQARVRAFREELRKRGWAASVNAQFDERWTSDNMDFVRSAAANLVELNPDVILASGARVVPILMELTRSIPIVTPSASDLIERGYAGGLARPGGNVTGFGSIEPSILGKMLQTLKEIAPIHNLGDIERAVAAAAAQPNGGIFVPLDVTMITFMHETIATIARHRLPTIYSERVFVTSGGLVSYGTDRVEPYRSAASYVDRILRGEKAGDLPFQLPTKYELVINLKTAKALGLTIPPNLLFTADEAIE